MNFFSVLHRTALGSAFGQAEYPLRAREKPAEGTIGEFDRFTPSGNPARADAGGDPPARVDPLALSISQPWIASRAEAPPPSPTLGAGEIAVLERVVERLSLGGDRRAAIARLELGGMWAGAVLVVRASGREIELRLEGGRNGADSRALGERLVARLRSRGLETALSVS